MSHHTLRLHAHTTPPTPAPSLLSALERHADGTALPIDLTVIREAGIDPDDEDACRSAQEAEVFARL